MNMVKNTFILIGILLSFSSFNAYSQALCPAWLKLQNFQPIDGSGAVIDVCRDSTPHIQAQCFANHNYPCAWIDDLKNKGLITTQSGHAVVEAKALQNADFDGLKNYRIAAAIRLRKDGDPSKLEVQGDSTFLKANFRLTLFDQLNIDLKPFREDVIYKRQSQVELWKVFINDRLMPELNSRIDAFPYFNNLDREELKASLNKVAAEATIKADNLMNEELETVQIYRRNILSRMLSKAALSANALTPAAKEEFYRQFIQLATTMKLSLPTPCHTYNSDFKSCFDWELWVNSLALPLDTMEPLIAAIPVMIQSNQLLKQDINGHFDESAVSLTTAQKYLDALRKKKDRISFDLAYAALLTATGTYSEQGRERWKVLTENLSPLKGAGYFAQGLTLRPIACTLFQNEILSKKSAAGRKIESILQAIQSLLSHFANDFTENNAEISQGFGIELDNLTAQLDEAIGESNRIVSFPSLTQDRVVLVRWDLKKLPIAFENLIGRRIQIELVQSGDFYWDPRSGLSLGETLPELVQLSSYNASLIPYGIGRVGVDGGLEAKLILSPETACIGQSIRVALRFPDFDANRIFALEASLN